MDVADQVRALCDDVARLVDQLQVIRARLELLERLVNPQEPPRNVVNLPDRRAR
jgi:hypothetical protein